ncbi:hypothetical protein [Gillisia sp. JM1]|uniref:hypothetical protein n=1 Tax=Gillisia sp. JM1 TaxID=1283286 RepID=UPI0004140B2B|nr:hypothetical protein [Gillisia sp. JM1]
MKELAIKQGGYRLERGSNFYKEASELTNEKSWVYNWEIDSIKNVGHDYKKNVFSSS